MITQDQGFCTDTICVKPTLTNQYLEKEPEVMAQRQPSEEGVIQTATAKQSPEAVSSSGHSVIGAVPVHFTFDYSIFNDQYLENKAKNTLCNFLGFVRQTFDGLLACGKALQELYDDCIGSFNNGKQIFESWIISTDFGASCYIAKSAITIYNWFIKLPQRVQQLVREKVQNWSVAALRQLTKVSQNLVQELVQSGKKTAAQIKTVGNTSSDQPSDSVNTPTPLNSNLQENTMRLATGLRVIIVNNDTEWNGCKGIITSKFKHSEQDSWWVLLDHVIAQGQETKTLFRVDQLQPEVLENNKKKTRSQQMFTAAEVEERIAEALAQRDREKAEEELGRYVEIRDAALQAAADEIRAIKQNAQKMREEKSQLLQQLVDKDQKIAELQQLYEKNQQLEQQVADLEKALQISNDNSWQNTFSKQAAKVVNSNLEKTIAPLMAEIERLKTNISSKDEELTQLKSVHQKQQEELTRILQSIVLSDSITPTQKEELASLKELLENTQSDYQVNQDVLSG
jgi:hypothetical protein